MLRHDHVTNHLEFIFLPDLFKDLQEQVPARRGAEKWFSLVTTTGDVVEIATSIEPAESFGHGRDFIPTLCGRGHSGTWERLVGRKGWGTHSIGKNQLLHGEVNVPIRDRGRVGNPELPFGSRSRTAKGQGRNFSAGERER